METGGLSLDDIIRKIIDIDKRARDIRKKADDDAGKEKQKIREDIEHLRNMTVERARNEAKELYDNAIKNAEAEAESIRAGAGTESRELEEAFLRIKDEAEARLFNHIIEGAGDGSHV